MYKWPLQMNIGSHSEELWSYVFDYLIILLECKTPLNFSLFLELVKENVKLQRATSYFKGQEVKLKSVSRSHYCH